MAENQGRIILKKEINMATLMIENGGIKFLYEITLLVKFVVKKVGDFKQIILSHIKNFLNYAWNCPMVEHFVSPVIKKRQPMDGRSIGMTKENRLSQEVFNFSDGKKVLDKTIEMF